MPLSFSAFLDACSGKVEGDGLPLDARFVPGTDSRTLQAGQAFVCLRGPSFDGHDFIAAAVAKRCSAVVIDDAVKVPADCAAPRILVADTKQAYLKGAAAARQLVKTRTIAVTGSNGKTTTTAMAAQLIRPSRRILATPHNENNELGVAKMCYALDDGVDAAVMEFGARHPGEIAQLVDIALPDIAVLTNIGEAHIEYFGSEEELAQTKFAIFGRNAKAVCNAADEWTRRLAAQSGIDRRALWIRLCGDPQAPGLTLEAGTPREGRVPITFGSSHRYAAWRLVGEQHLRDALLAAGAALSIGLDLDEVIAGFGDLRLPPGRFEIHDLDCGAKVVYDAYNASPTAVIHALRAFVALPATRRVAVLGSMAELGPHALEQHERTGTAAARCGIDLLFCGGEYREALAKAALRAGMSAAHIGIYDDNADITATLERTLRSGDAVLLKGSRIQRMEEILTALLASNVAAS